MKTRRERALGVGLLLLWALLFLPNLRTNPNWYGDEGEWVEMSWALAHGSPRVGPLKNDFIFPTPYPPLYMLLNGALMRLFGYDIVVGRALGSVTALVTAALLFWIGVRLRNKTFGFLAAAAFLVYPEAVINFRWVRAHPLAGMWTLAAVGFLVRYVQEQRLRDIVLAGALCAVATATNYFTYPLIVAVIATALFVNWRHALAAAAAAGSFGILLVGWYLTTQGGIGHLVEQAGRAAGMAGGEGHPSLLGQAVKFYRNVISFGFLTPTLGTDGKQGVDLWLIGAMLGILLFPVVRFRKWLTLWLLAIMFAVFKKLDNVSIFFYPATIFLPVLALGVAGALDRIGEMAGRRLKPATIWLPVGMLAVFGLMSLNGALDRFRTKIDPWTQHSVADAEAVGRFLNENAAGEDLVILPKQIYWLVRNARVAMLWQTVPFEGRTTEAYPIAIPRELFAYDPHWKSAKFVVLAYGQDASGRPYGIDAVYTMALQGMREIIQSIQQENWPVVLRRGEYMVLANPRFTK